MAGFNNERIFREAIRTSNAYGILCDLGIFLLRLVASAYKHVDSEIRASLKGWEMECLGGGWWQMPELPRSVSSTIPLKFAQHHRYPRLYFARLAARFAFLQIAAVSDLRPLSLDRISLCNCWGRLRLLYDATGTLEKKWSEEMVAPRAARLDIVAARGNNPKRNGSVRCLGMWLMRGGSVVARKILTGALRRLTLSSVPGLRRPHATVKSCSSCRRFWLHGFVHPLLISGAGCALFAF